MNRDNTINLVTASLLQGFKFLSWIPESFDISFVDNPEYLAKIKNIKL